MNILHHLAMTAAEFSSADPLPANIAWMSCHFALDGKGLSNMPPPLPPGSLIVIDDSTPPSSHDAAVIASQLSAYTAAGKIGGILLDFQRPGSAVLQNLAEQLTSRLTCPVCVSSLYAEELDCPVFLSSPPLHNSLDDWLLPWKSRELWLEIALEAETITVTHIGSEITPLSPFPMEALPFTDESLWCRYQVQVLEDRAVFTLARDLAMANRLIAAASKRNVFRFISLYQQISKAAGSQS